VSTVLDVGLACLLVTASATLLVTGPGPQRTPADADRTGRALLASTLTVPTSTGHDTTTSVGSLLVHAATTDGLDRPQRHAVRERLRAITPRAAVHLGPPPGEPSLVVGQRPPPGAQVNAAVFRIGTSENADRQPVVVTVRTWST
jgi:hypothetical protein